ncbi:MAG: hypothetical protein FWH02_09235, partial [Oscillospiraceae bacterium]|nr:hypothetical protein [Oscillospiraceae bacterium]
MRGKGMNKYSNSGCPLPELLYLPCLAAAQARSARNYLLSFCAAKKKVTKKNAVAAARSATQSLTFFLSRQKESNKEKRGLGGWGPLPPL